MKFLSRFGKVGLISAFACFSFGAYASGVCKGVLKNDPDSLTAMQRAAQSADKRELKRWLLTECIDVKKAIATTNTPAFFFATDVETLSWYQARGVNFGEKSKDGMTAFMYAFAQRSNSGKDTKQIRERVALWQDQIQEGESRALYEQDALGRTALHFAIMTGRTEAAKALLFKNSGLLRSGKREGQYAWFYAFQDTCVGKPIAKELLESMRAYSTVNDLIQTTPSPFAPWLAISVAEFAVLKQEKFPFAAKTVKEVVGLKAWESAKEETIRLKKERPDLEKKLRTFEYTSVQKICDAAVED